MIDFLSEEYIDFTMPYTSATRRLLADNPYAEVCKILDGGYVILYIPRTQLSEFLTAASTMLIPAYTTIHGLMGTIDLEASGIIAAQNQPYLNLYGQGVLLGFVDTGIDYSNDTFKYQDGSTRIAAIWDQTIYGNIPYGYCFGAEYTRNDINAALASENPTDTVPHRDESGHGTFLASVAGGRESSGTLGAAPLAEFVIVKLKRIKQFFRDNYLIPESQQYAYSSGDIMLGLDYLINKASELKKPIAISIGLGSSYSGHDGYSYLQNYLSRTASQTGVFISVAAGNESNAKHHTMASVVNGGKRDIEIRSGENEQGFMVMLWTLAQDRMSVSVTSPLGETIGRVPAEDGLVRAISLTLENTVVTIEYHFPLATTGSQMSAVKFKNPTPGIWTITVYGDMILNGEFHAWLPVSGFVDSETVFLTPVPYYTVSGTATAFGVVSCGAYSSVNQGLYVSSSWGPSRFLTQIPDLTAPGANVMGIYPWGAGSMSGTSVSSAITAGAGALILQWGNARGLPLNSIIIGTYLRNGCTRRPGLSYPNYQWGYGELNLIRTFEIMRQIP